MNKSTLEKKKIKSAADVRVFLATHLTAYTKESEDDFIFIVTPEELERVALKLWQHLPIRADA